MDQLKPLPLKGKSIVIMIGIFKTLCLVAVLLAGLYLLAFIMRGEEYFTSIVLIVLALGLALYAIVSYIFHVVLHQYVNKAITSSELLLKKTNISDEELLEHDADYFVNQYEGLLNSLRHEYFIPNFTMTLRKLDLVLYIGFLLYVNYIYAIVIILILWLLTGIIYSTLNRIKLRVQKDNTFIKEEKNLYEIEEFIDEQELIASRRQEVQKKVKKLFKEYTYHTDQLNQTIAHDMTFLFKIVLVAVLVIIILGVLIASLDLILMQAHAVSFIPRVNIDSVVISLITIGLIIYEYSMLELSKHKIEMIAK